MPKAYTYDSLSTRFPCPMLPLGLRATWPAALATLLSLILVVSGLSLNPGVRELLVGFLCVFSVYVTLLPIHALKNETILSPVYFLGLVVFISMPLRFFVLSAYPQLEDTTWFLASHSVGDFVVGAVMTAVGLSVVSVTYMSTPYRVILPDGLRVGYGNIRMNRLLTVAVILIPLALYALWVGIERSDVEYLSAKRGVIEDGVRYSDAYWSLLIQYARYVSFLVVAVAVWRRKFFSLFGLISSLGFAISLFDAFSSQVRAYVPLSLLGFFILWSGVRGTVPWARLSVLVLLGALVFVVMSEIRFGQQGGTAYLHVETLQQLSTAERFAVSAGGAFNLGGFVANSMAHEVIPDVLPFQYGATVAQLITTPIPRRLWPDKPESLGVMWLHTFMGRDILRSGGGAQAGLFAEGYLNFGWFGVVFFSWAFGVLLRVYSNSVSNYALSSPVTLVLLVIWNVALTYRLYGYGFVSGMVDLLTSLVFLWILGIMIRGQKS